VVVLAQVDPATGANHSSVVNHGGVPTTAKPCRGLRVLLDQAALAACSCCTYGCPSRCWARSSSTSLGQGQRRWRRNRRGHEAYGQWDRRLTLKPSACACSQERSQGTGRQRTQMHRHCRREQPRAARPETVRQLVTTARLHATAGTINRGGPVHREQQRRRTAADAGRSIQGR
jgi:hypothetical protein